MELNGAATPQNANEFLTLLFWVLLFPSIDHRFSTATAA
jgi:hypothetical protein